MDDITTPLMLALLRTTAYLGVAAIIGGLLLRSVRSATPRRQAMVWTIVLFQGWLWLGVTVEIPWPIADAKSSEAPSDNSVIPNGDTMRARGQIVAVEPAGSTIRAPRDPSLSLVSSVSNSLEYGADWIRSHSTILTAGWVLGMVAWLVTFAIRYMRFLSSLKSGRRPCATWERELQNVSRRLGIQQRVRVRVTENLGPLLVCRMSGHEIVVPESLWVRLSPAQRVSI